MFILPAIPSDAGSAPHQPAITQGGVHSTNHRSIHSSDSAIHSSGRHRRGSKSATAQVAVNVPPYIPLTLQTLPYEYFIPALVPSPSPPLSPPPPYLVEAWAPAPSALYLSPPTATTATAAAAAAAAADAAAAAAAAAAAPCGPLYGAFRAVCINLDGRPDRLASINANLHAVGMTAMRFRALTGKVASPFTPSPIPPPPLPHAFAHLSKEGRAGEARPPCFSRLCFPPRPARPALLHPLAPPAGD